MPAMIPRDWQRDNNEETRSARELEAALWPGWTGVRRGPDHTHTAHLRSGTDREHTDERRRL